VKQLSVRNIGILIVEQNATAALSAATSGYLLESGTAGLYRRRSLSVGENHGTT
jgi:ABC-type branched-subunit amino acid transport system ATPase component